MKILKYISDKYPELDLTKKRVEIPNTTREDLLTILADNKAKTGAEIGTLRGEFADKMFKMIPGLSLYCVDPYEVYSGYREHREEGELKGYELDAKKLLKDQQVEFVKEYSVKASKQFATNELDFVYIDANHAFRHVVDDIDSWYPKIAHGGIVAGHDFIKHKKSRGLHVVEAVTAFCEAYSIAPLFILGRKETVSDEKRDRIRSWFFIKP